MKHRLVIILALLGVFFRSNGQQTSSWAIMEGLIGEWKGEGTGKPGQGDGVFSFSFSLDNKIIERKSHSEYQTAENKPLIIHNDLMIIYLDFNGSPSKAIYFDNEGHTINYTISYSEKTIVFVSDKIQNMPIFRLTYTFINAKTLQTKFEISQDGEKFMTYIEGTSKKTK